MSKRSIGLVAVAAVLVASAAGAYSTRERWIPFVIPSQTDEKVVEDEHVHSHGDRVKLSSQAKLNLKLEVGPVEPREYWRKMVVPGAIVDRPGESDRGVTSRVAGIVGEIKARPGDTVKAGEPLFTIQLASEFLQSTQTELYKVGRELSFAEKRRDTTANLVKIGTKSNVELAEDENLARRLSTQVQSYRRQLQILGLTPPQIDKAERGELITEMVVRAPERSYAQPDQKSVSDSKDGALTFEMQDLKVQLGEQVHAGQTLCTLANHQRLYVEGRAFKSEAKALSTAIEMDLPIDAEFNDETPGDWTKLGPLRIHHLSNTVDPLSRTFAFYLPLENQPDTFLKDGKTFFIWRFRPGQRVRLRIPVEKLGDDVFVLPAGAVVREGPEAYVFRQNGESFQRVAVRVLYEDRVEAVVANDGSIGAGQSIVRNQAATLNRALKAASQEHGGGHECCGHEH